MNKFRIYATVTRTQYGYMGKLTCYRAEEKLWEDTSEIERLTIEDALIDAAKMRDEAESINLF